MASTSSSVPPAAVTPSASAGFDCLGKIRGAFSDFANSWNNEDLASNTRVTTLFLGIVLIMLSDGTIVKGAGCVCLYIAYRFDIRTTALHEEAIIKRYRSGPPAFVPADNGSVERKETPHPTVKTS